MNGLERIGGEAALSAIVNDFIGRCYDDVMIGFLFKRPERSRIERHEYELLASHLGAPVNYTGRPLGDAHRPHRILGGQFDRRRRLFEQTLEAHGVDETLRAELLAWQDSLRPLVAGPPTSSGCLPPDSEAS
jgi:hemoglobin